METALKDLDPVGQYGSTTRETNNGAESFLGTPTILAQQQCCIKTAIQMVVWFYYLSW